MVSAESRKPSRWWSWTRRSTAGYIQTSTSATTPTRINRHVSPTQHHVGTDDEYIPTSTFSSLALARCTFILLLTAFAIALIFFFDDVKADLLLCLEWIHGLGLFYGSLALCAANIIAALLFLPCLPFTLGAGFLYGTLIGTLVISIASTIAAVCAFLTSRYLARRVVERQLLGPKGSRFRQIDHAIHSDGFRIVFLIRSSPLHPYGVCNYLFGLTSVTLKDYAAASFIGMLPATIMEVYFGTAMKNVTDIIDGKIESSPASKIFFWGGLAITVIISASVSWWLKRKLSQELEKYAEQVRRKQRIMETKGTKKKKKKKRTPRCRDRSETNHLADDEDIDAVEDELSSTAPVRQKRIKIMSRRVHASTIEMVTPDGVAQGTTQTQGLTTNGSQIDLSHSPAQHTTQLTTQKQEQDEEHDIDLILTPSHSSSPSHHLDINDDLVDDDDLDEGMRMGMEDDIQSNIPSVTLTSLTVPASYPTLLSHSPSQTATSAIASPAPVSPSLVSLSHSHTPVSAAASLASASATASSRSPIHPIRFVVRNGQLKPLHSSHHAHRADVATTTTTSTTHEKRAERERQPLMPTNVQPVTSQTVTLGQNQMMKPRNASVTSTAPVPVPHRSTLTSPSVGKMDVSKRA